MTPELGILITHVLNLTFLSACRADAVFLNMLGSGGGWGLVSMHCLQALVFTVENQ